MLNINGTMGEGGGQILRSSLALSAVTQQEFSLSKIRGKRSNPGLQAQHLCCVRAAARVCNAAVEGDELRSSAITFYPQGISSGYYEFEIGTAGSCSLVLQTVLPMILYGRCSVELRIRGGTHNPWSPSIDFIQHSFVPQLLRMGAEVQVEVEAPGFYPRGGGCIHAVIDATNFGKALHVRERGRMRRLHSLITSVNLPTHIAEREMEVIRRKLGIKKKDQTHDSLTSARCEGNFVSVIAEAEHITECFGEPGRRGVSAERIADKVCEQVKQYQKYQAPVGEHLADQLILPLLLGGGGSYLATAASLHSTTNAAVVALFCGERVTIEETNLGQVFTIQPWPEQQ